MNWIKCEDRLPEDEREVLVYYSEDRHISVGYFELNNASFYIESNENNFFYKDDGWETECPWSTKGGVTHWMDLPCIPKD